MSNSHPLERTVQQPSPLRKHLTFSAFAVVTTIVIVATAGIVVGRASAPAIVLLQVERPQPIKPVTEVYAHLSESLVNDWRFSPSVLQGARFVPQYDGEHLNGYKLFAIRPSSPFAIIGLSNGDIVTAMDGTSLMDSKKASAQIATTSERLAGLANSAPFTISLTRNQTRLRYIVSSAARH